MGVNFSKPSESNPSSTATATATTTATAAANSSPTIPKSETESTQSPENPEPKTPIEENQGENETQLEKVSEDSINEETQLEKVSEDSINEENEEDEEGECGFCLFMKSGGCKDTFTEWEKCVDEGEKNKENIVDKCFEATSALKKCMEAHTDYYAPVLQAEKAAEEQLVNHFEQEKNDDELGKREKEEALDDSKKNKAS